MYDHSTLVNDYRQTNKSYKLLFLLLDKKEKYLWKKHRSKKFCHKEKLVRLDEPAINLSPK